MACLTAIDLIGIQRFIFRSNRLKDVVSSSKSVSWATAPEGALRETGATSQQILMAAGGNAMIMFPSLADAKGFAARYSRLILKKCPGLEAAIVHLEYSSGQLGQTLAKVHRELEHAKRSRKPNAPLLGIGVNAVCTETGLPAVAEKEEDDTALLSRSIREIRRRAGRLESPAAMFPSVAWPIPSDKLSFPLDIDKLGRTEGHFSYAAVVHADGNGIGRHIAKWLSSRIDAGATDELIRHEYSEWSQALDKAAQGAMEAAVSRLASATVLNERVGLNQNQRVLTAISSLGENRGFDYIPDGDGYFLPLRPILIGGDDLTFVCDGRLALSLAEAVLEAFENAEIPHLGKLSAAAGIAIIPVHAPFSRAYELAESLCGSAKQLVRSAGGNASSLDWHIGQPAPGRSIRDIRALEYAHGDFELTCRPYLLKNGVNDVSWSWLEDELLQSFFSDPWVGSKNKVKELRELLRGGPAAIRRNIDLWCLLDKRRKFCLPTLIPDGFKGSRTSLLDAVELFNFHVSLNTRGAKKVVSHA
jgi:hypothetical protein